MQHQEEKKPQNSGEYNGKPTEDTSSQEPIKGAQITVQFLERAGVENVFAYPGGASMELHQALIDSEVRVVLPRHEQGGAFAASGYARASGNAGVCMATSGPGATNLLTGLADAYMDSIPLVAFTGQVPQSFIGKNAFQETDIIGMTRPIVKHSYLVLNAENIPEILAQAFFLAKTGRPGPVLIDMPKDVQQQRCVPHFPEQIKMRSYNLKRTVSKEEVQSVREAIEQSEQPCIYAGGGILAGQASEELKKFAESYNIPVVTTLMGIGAFPETHPLSLKWLGMHGTYYANYAANECDLLLAFGARFDDRVTGKVDKFAANAEIVHIDIDPSEINKNKTVNIGITGDVKDLLKQLNENPCYKEYDAWHKQIAEWKENHPLSYKKTENIQPQYVVETLHEQTQGEAIIVTGVGQHQMWAGQFYNFTHPRQFVTSGGLGAMGFGLPTALGVKTARPDAIVIDIDGDGSFQMNIQELGAMYAENISVKMVVLNNQHLGMVAQWEDRFYDSKRGNTSLQNERSNRPYPEFIQIAWGYHIQGREVWRKEEVAEAVQEMLESEGPYVLDIHVEYYDHVVPMIPPGGSYKDIMME